MTYPAPEPTENNAAPTPPPAAMPVQQAPAPQFAPPPPTPTPTPAPTPAPANVSQRGRTGRIAIILSAAVVVILGTIGAAVTVSLQQTAAQNQAYEDALIERSEAFRLDAQRCNIASGDYERLDGGEAIQFDRISKYDGATYSSVWCFLELQEAPDSLDAKIGRTRPLDGTREQAWNDLLATWTYPPDSGLDILVERTDTPPARE